ncbi:ATP-binding cassette domain-containing protein [Arcobacter cryaerophilus gv. pseudocryaerophilus]|uniref:ATP-binding cassette domain-containing protein n=3 Tax=unclassified Arcobacter TaxID=2593671 RepID=A0AA96IJF0_9BACT|nr:ATP-binding cassette domain-containing protein [Arcobacter sp. AZ-2023]WPD04887.1 ATP-binding cassette domain-containing protein [Arcobacter sp. DSM 115956]WPD06982.1 ATP-binding cassette domain-containing protein [Arcobacter sp. DSM 115955]WNL31247.1 ATP-binding cassette domain-containing protein [Arcobacter sp. AZ-2023]WNP37397.1 ATP-binding cassette domain-containing protein [Arcobacter sp. AZ-2023]
MNIIEFENIDVGYDEKVVLKDINLKIKSGEHFAILGANGSGKSTLMKLIQSQIHPRQTKEFKKKIFGKSRYSIFELKKELGVITNDLHNYFEKEAGYLNGFEVVLSGYYSSIGIFTHQDFTKEQIKKALEVMNFLEIIDLKDKKVSSMSTGQLRKCIVARALIHYPKAFVLDEPTVGLDIKAQINFIKLLQKISLKSTIILVTHHLEEIFPEIKNVALIYNNTIFKIGKKEDILNSENLSTVFDIKIEVKQKNERYYIETIL